MTDDLVTRAKTLSAMINLGERIAWGQDTAMIDELAARIEADAATIARLEGERDYEREMATLFRSQRIVAEAKVAALVEAMREIWEYCQNSGRGSELVDDRIIERCEETARAAIAAAKGGK